MTEFMPSPEVAKVFDRISDKVELKGATDAAEIESRLQSYVDINKTRAKIARRKSTRVRDMWRADQVDRLIEHGFPERLIREALRQPRGLIAQTLLYGKAEAKRRVVEYRRRRIQAAYPMAGVRPAVPTLPPLPETRRMRPWWRQRR